MECFLLIYMFFSLTLSYCSSVLMACFLEDLRNALFVLGIFFILEGCTNAVGSYQPGASVHTPQLNLCVYQGSGTSQKGQKMNILARYIFWLKIEY